jgi:hypothetical protein
MADNEKHAIRNGTIAGVAAGVILSLLYFIPRLAALLLNLLIQVGRYSFSSISIPKWLFIVLFSFSLLFILGPIKRLFTKETDDSERNVQPELDMYTQDSFFGVWWQWSSYYNPEPTLTAYCPSCQTPLVYSAPFRVAVTFICETCRLEVAHFDCDFQQTLRKVARQIERKTRSGEWKQAVESQLEEKPIHKRT